jgi:hypothetical protein
MRIEAAHTSLTVASFDGVIDEPATEHIDTISSYEIDQDDEPPIERLFPFLSYLDTCLSSSIVDYLEEFCAFIHDYIAELLGYEYREVIQETTADKILKLSQDALPILVTPEGDHFLLFEELELWEGAPIEISKDRATPDCGSELCTNTETGKTVRAMRFSDFQVSKTREAKEFRQLIESAKL